MVEKPVSLKDIMKLVERTRSREMNFFIPWQVYDFLMTVTLSKWEKICVDAFGVVEKHLKNIIKETSTLVFRRFQTSGLASAAEYLPIETLHLTKPRRSAALEVLDKLAEETRDFIAMYCSWETSRPFTQNDDYMDYLRGRISEYMCQHRYAVLDVVPGPFNNPQNQTLRPPPVGLERLFGELPENAMILTSEELFSRYKQDKDAHVLEIVVNTAAYFRVACKRVIDIVPMCIENRFLLMLSRALRDNLENDLGLLSEDAAEICARFIVEEPDANERRENLTSMKATILEGLKIIGELTTVRA